jgi:hypothetical protein
MHFIARSPSQTVGIRTRARDETRAEAMPQRARELSRLLGDNRGCIAAATKDPAGNASSSVSCV